MQGFTVKRTEHASLVAKLARIAQGRTTLEALQTIKFDVSEDLITMTATDLQTAIVVSMKASSTKNGSFCLPAKRYAETNLIYSSVIGYLLLMVEEVIIRRRYL